jgi:hypothetical protein
MRTNVTPNEFEVRDGLVVHKPTEAEFIPHPTREDSVLVWTGKIGKRLPNGAVYHYADVLDAMKAFWWARPKKAEGPLAA